MLPPPLRQQVFMNIYKLRWAGRHLAKGVNDVKLVTCKITNGQACLSLKKSWRMILLNNLLCAGIVASIDSFEIMS